MNTESPTATLKTGQVWQLPDCRIEIGLVGRTLVHYRRLRGSLVRLPILLASQQSLEQELSKAKAVLLDEAPACPPAGLLRTMKPRSKRAATNLP